MKRVFISYSADSEEHRARVLALANQLRREGIDATLDAFAPTSADGSRARAIDDASFVLAICTERYKAEFEGRAQGGAAAEAEGIAELAARRPGRVVPVLLEGGQPTYVPQALRAVAAVYLPEQLPQLLRQLGATGAPAPPLPAPAPLARGPATIPTAKAVEGTSGRMERRISNISLLGSPDFVGRTFELSAIRTAMSAARQGGAGEPLIVIGATGIGKTALVLQHAFRQQEAYDVIWLVRAESDSTIRLDLALLARELGLLAPGVTDDEAEVLAARAWLAAHDRWLLVFDEAPGAGAIAPYVPRPLRGHVLVTSRGSDWREAGKKMLLGALAREESIDLLLRASGRGEAVGADELAAWLEGHPLMAKLAGALARDRGVTLDVLHRQLAGGAGPRPSHRLEAILGMAVEDARQRSPAILALVELIAYLAPHEIPIRLLREHVEQLPPELGAIARDDNALVRLLDDLVRLGMATRDDSSLSVHAAVQAAIRVTARSGAAVALLDAAFAWDEEHPETWVAAEDLLPHVLVAIEDPHAPVARPRELQRLLVRTASCMWKRGEPYRAIALQHRAIALLEARLKAPASALASAPPSALAEVPEAAPPEVPVGAPVEAPGTALAGALVTLGGMLREVGELADAGQALERARRLLAADGAADEVPVLREQARVAAARGDFAGARAQLEQALALDRERLGVDDDLSIAATLADLSGVEVEADRLDAAAELLERALAMQRRLLATDDHPAVAATLKRSAAILARRGDLPEARARLERALEVLRRVLRTDHHVAIVDVMNELASVLMRLGDTIGAQRLLEQTLEIQARLFGGGANPGGAAVSYNLARVLILQSDLMGARRLLERTLAGLHTQGVVPTHPTVASILELLGELDAPSNLAASRARYEQALEIRRQLSGPGSPEVMQATASLAQVAARLGNHDEAAQLLEPMLAHVLTGGEGPLRAGAPEALFVTADVLARLGRATSARDLLTGVLASLDRHHADALTLARGRLALARIHLQIDDLAEARREAREAHEMLVGALGAGTLADGEAALLRAGIALRGDELPAAFGLAARAHRIFDAKGDTAARDAAAGALEVAGRAALGLERRATAAALLQRSLERRDAPEIREALFELIEELAATGSPYDRAPAVAVLQRLAPAWLADSAFAAAALDSAQITTQLEVALSIAGAATAAAIPPVGPPAPVAAPPPPPSGTASKSVVSLIRARHHRLYAQGATPAPQGPFSQGLVPQGLAPQGPAPQGPQPQGPAPQGSQQQLPPPSPPPPTTPPPVEYGFRLELAPIRAEGVASEVRTLEVQPRYVGPGRLALVASTADLPWGTYLLTVRFVDGARTVWRADVTIGNVELGNPFLAGPPVKGERFFGRGRLLDEMIRHLEDASIVLLGPRRSGKTSVLYRLQQLCAESWTVVVVDLHAYSGLDDRVFLRELAGQIARVAGIDAPDVDRPLLALRRSLAAAGTRRVMLLLDEMAILARYPDAALQLRAMSKWESPQVRVVIAGTSRDLDRLTSTTVRGSSPVNEFLNRELDQLTRQEALALLEQPVLGRYRYEPAALDRLLELGAGRPFFLNSLAHLTLEVVRQEGVRVITAAHVEAARQEAAMTLARWYRELVGELDDASRAALPALTEAGGQIPLQHAEALRSAGIVVGPRRAMTLDPIFIDWWRRGGSR